MAEFSQNKDRSNMKCFRYLLRGSTKTLVKLEKEVLLIGKTGYNNTENTNV